MRKRILSWGLILSLLLTMLPVSAIAAEDELAGSGLSVTERPQCTCEAEPDADGVMVHQEGCPLYEAPTGEEPSAEDGCTCGAEPDEAGIITHTDDCPLYEEPACSCGAQPDEAGVVIHAEGCPLAVQEEPPLKTEEPVLEALTPPTLTCEPLDEENSSDMVLTVGGNWDSYAWESCSYGFWSDWSGDGPCLILSKEDFTAYGFRCTVTRGEQSVTSETFAYDTSVLELPAMMANGFTDDLLSGSSDYIQFGKRLPNSTFFNIKGRDNGYEIQTTYADAGYRTAISVDGGTKKSVFYNGEPTSVGNSLTAENRLEIVYGGRYVKVTYEVTNHGSTTQEFQIGSSADVMIDNNDHAKVVGVKSSTGKYTGLSMDGSPKNSYQFSLVAPDCNTLWYGYYSKAYINIFNNLSDKDTPYSKDSGMAWSWRGTVAPGQTWIRYVLIGAGELPPAPDAPLINGFPTLKAGEEFTISGTVNMGGNPPDTVHVSIGGKEYEASVNEDGIFAVTDTLPEDTPAGETTLTYWGTTDDGGISEIQSGSITVVAAPYISLTTDSVTVMEGDTGLDEAWLRGFIKSNSDTVNISPSTIDTNTPEKKTVTYKVEKEGFTPATAQLTVTVLPQPAALTQTITSGTGTFALSSTMTYTGGLDYKETGFVYGALQNPTLDLNDGKVTTSPVVNTKGSTLSASVDGSKLAYGVTYYARAYAIASDGTIIYGGQSTGFGMGTPNYGTFSVTGSGNTFTITRTGGTNGEQTVYYRTVNGSAVGGTHFEHKYGTLTFKDGAQNSQTVTVTEKGVTSTYNGSAATAYSNADRTYSFEIYRVVGGAIIDSNRKSAERTMTKDSSKEINATSLYNEQTINGKQEKQQQSAANWESNARESVTVNLNYKEYYLETANYLKYWVTFEAAEEEDGYQAIQICQGNNIYTSLTHNEDTLGNLQEPAVYAAVFEHGGSKRDKNYKAYSFPSDPSTWSTSGSTLSTYKYGTEQSGSYLKFAPTTETITLGFKADGEDQDDWFRQKVVHHFQVSDTQEPQLLGVAPMAGGSYLPGDSVTVALVFNEIVDSAKSNLSSVSINTNWGTFHYAGGGDTNVLYFTGTVSDTASGTLTVNSITHAEYIKDMAEDSGTDTSGTVSGGDTGADLGTGDNAPAVTVDQITNANGILAAAVSSTSSNVKLEYVWSQSSTAPTTGWQIVVNGSTVSTRQTGGTWYLHARATNSDGVTTYASSSYTFTGSDPVQPPSLTVNADNTNWAKERVITITRSPANAKVTVKTPDGTTAAVPSGTYAATANDTYTFTLESGGETITQMVTVSKLDTTAPSVEIVDLTNTNHTEAVTLTVRVSDGESGVGTVTGTWSSGSTSKSAVFTSQNGVYTTTSPDESGTWTLAVTATDAVGNTGRSTSSAYIISADRPGLTVTKDEEASGDKGIVYHYTVTENGNTGITVALPDGSITTVLTGTFTITEPGDYVIAVTDAAGHFVSQDITVEEPESGTLDGVAPDVRLNIESEAWTNQAVTVTVSVYDAGSHGKSLTASRDGQAIPLTESADEPGSFTGSFEVSANGTYTVTCTDAAGNTGSGEISITNIDTTVPGITVSGTPTGWTASDVTITLTVTDEQSGVSGVEVNRGGSTVPVSGSGGTYTFTASENGDYTVTVTDKAGNSKSETVTISKIDKNTPTLAVTGGMQSAEQLTLTVTDTNSGISGVTVTVTKEGQNVGTVQNDSYTVTSAGTYTFTATTGAGLTADQTVTVHSIAFLNDSTPYETHLVVSGGTAIEPTEPTKTGYAFAGWYNGDTPWDFTNGKVTQDLTLTAHWTLADATVALSADQTEATYQGGQTVITLTAVPSHGATGVTYAFAWYKDDSDIPIAKESEATLTLTDVADSGTYTVKVTASADGQSAVVTSNSITVTISRATPAVFAWPTASGITYGKNLGESSLTGGSAEIQGAFTWQDNSIAPNSGSQSCMVVFTPNDTDNYNTVEGSVIVQVAKAVLTPSVISVADKVYDGNTSATGTISLSGAVLNELPTASGVFTFGDAGAGEGKPVSITVTLDDGWDSNYVLSQPTLTATADIIPRTVGLVWQDYEELVYTGQPVNVTAVATGLVGGDACTVIVAGGNGTEVGSYTAVATGLSNPNYQLPDTGTIREYTIAQAVGSASVTMEGWTYGGTAAAPVPTSATHGTDNVTYHYTGITAGGAAYNSDAAPIEAGSYTVTATFAATDNYAGITAAADFTIAPKPIFATWLALTHVYDGTLKTAEVSLSGVLPTDACTISVSGYQQEGKPVPAPADAGTYSAAAVLRGGDAHNYTLKNSTATLTVQPKPVLFVVKDNAVQADGREKQATVTVDDETCTYAVTYRQSGKEILAPKEPGSYEIWVKLANPNFRHTNGSIEMQVGTLTITQASPVVYTATFAAGENAGGAAPAAQTAVKDGQITLPANSFTKENHLFAGWTADGDTRLYQPGDSFTMPARNVTFTAQWQAVFEVGGTIKEKTDGEDVEAENAVVSLWLGANKISEVTTENDGTFRFENLVPGIYNLVVTKDVRTITSKVELTENKTCDAVLPKGATNSIVEVTPGSPDIVVGKLDTVFDKIDGVVYTQDDQDNVDAGGKVEITFTADEKQMGDSSISSDMDKIAGKKDDTVTIGLVMDYTLKKEVFDENGNKDEDASKRITLSNVLLEIRLPLPAELQGKAGYAVYRVHNNQAEAMKANPGSGEEGFKVEGSYITIYAQKFSTYAIGYTESSGNNNNNNQSSGGGGSSTPTYPPSIEEPEHGSVTVSPKNPEKGDQVTITPTPDEEYTVDTVIVTDPNGKPVAVTPNDDGTYAFVQPTGKVTITVTFRKLTSVSDCPRDKSCPMAPFTDADRNAWYHDGIHYCVEHGLMSGYGNGIFGPNKSLSRGMLVQILYNLEDRPATSDAEMFKDVPDSAWCFDAVNWAASVGIVGGYGNGMYRPDDSITREQLAAMLYRYAQYKEYDVSVGEGTNLLSYTDASRISEYAIPAMQWACGTGIIAGVTSSTLVPKGTATRAQVATMLMRFADKVAQ